jgi:cobalt-zinc-cadmium efflux system membrane fusion protein
MNRRTNRILSESLAALSLAASCAAIPACQRSSQAAQTPALQPPAGEVWLTANQVKDAKIAVETVEERAVDDTILTSGRIAFDDGQVGHVFPAVTGRVARIVAQLGEHVKRGQALATIESPDIGNAVSDQHKAEADLIAAEHDHKRQQSLFEQHATSQASLEQSEDNWRKARAELERARQKAYLLRASDVDAVTQTYTLRSPIEGEVLMRNVSPGVEVQGQYGGGQAVELFTIGEIDRVWVMADLYEMDLARVHVGSPATVTVIAYPNRTFHGTVDWVSGMLDPTTRTAKVRFRLENADRSLKPEMYATARISVDQKMALAIPRPALLRLGDYRVVFVQVGDSDGIAKFARLPVDVDEGESSPWLEVKHGLEIGQKIVTSGSVLLSQKL